MLKKRLPALLISTVFSLAFLWSQNNSVNFWTRMPNDQLAEKITDEMTDTELLSQTFMFGWAGAEPPELLYQWVERGLGSVKVFGWNTDDIYLVAKSISGLQTQAAEGRFQIPLFVATDQEGGWIRHVKGDTTETPGNMAIGASRYPIDAYYSAFYISREIKARRPSHSAFSAHSSSDSPTSAMSSLIWNRTP